LHYYQSFYNALLSASGARLSYFSE